MSTPNSEQLSDEALTAAGLDVAETDDFLYSLFLPRFAAIFKHFDGNIPHVWIQALIQSATLWMTVGQTPATQALGLKTVENTSYTTIQRITTPKRSSIAKWIVLSIVLPAFYKQIRIWYDSSISSTDTDDGDDDVRNDSVSRAAKERRLQLARVLLDTVDRKLPIMRLVTLLSWWSGRTKTPTVAMMLAGMSLVSTRPPRRLHVSYAHRRWLYQEVVQTLSTLAPYSSWSDFSLCWSGLTRPVKDSWRRIRQESGEGSGSRCPICRSDSIVVPYATNCGHVYCYSCLWNATSNYERYKCRVCRCVVSSIGPHVVIDTKNS